MLQKHFPVRGPIVRQKEDFHQSGGWGGEGGNREGGGGRNSMNKGNSRSASSLTIKLTFTFTCPGQMLK